MALRSLLGYEPRSMSQREDYGGKFIAVTPSPKVMASRSQINKNKTPMATVKRLPRIDEELGGLSPRLTPRMRPHGGMKRLPKSTFIPNTREDNVGFEPVSRKPVVSVRPMPRYKTPPPPARELDVKKDFKESVPLKPLDVNHTIVDGLVADYLHYSRYGHVIPVYEGTSSTSCPCCTDRNRQNVRTILGFPKDVKDAPKKYDNHSRVKLVNDDPGADGDILLFPNSMYAYAERKREPKLTDDQIRYQQLAEQSKKQTWMNYQPMPYATTYLSPEFNRPSKVRGYYDSMRQDDKSYMANQVVEANTNYDQAMNRLGNLKFGSTTRNHFHHDTDYDYY